MALCSGGTVAAWGEDTCGELGDNAGNFPFGTGLPVMVYTNSVLSNKTVIAIAAGWELSLALCSDGTVAAWGNNYFGQLGDGTTYMPSFGPFGHPIPQAMSTNSILSNKTVVAIAAGEYHCLALCSDGTVAAWGENNQGQIGDGTTGNNRLVPVTVSTNSALSNRTVVAVAAAADYSLALCSDGTVAAWGSGYLGTGITTSASVPIAVSREGVLSNKTVVAIGAAWIHSLALCSDGTAVAWGDNALGEIGNGTTVGTNLPVAVAMSSLPVGARFTHVSTGEEAEHTLAMVALSTAPNVTGITPAGGGAFKTKFTGFPGFGYDIQASTNLLDWLTVGSQTADTNGLFQFTDPTAPSYDHRFYRAKSQ